METDPIIIDIINRLKAIPDMKHLFYDTYGRRCRIYGKYDMIEKIKIDHYYVMFRRAKIAINMNLHTIEDCVEAVVDRANSETIPRVVEKEFEKRYYRENFPCLAAEVSFEYYKDYHFAMGAHMAESNRYLHLKILHRFEHLALERKLRAAFDGTGLPIPIRQAIMTVCGFDE